MRIRVNSNIASGVYTLTEVATTLLLIHSIRKVFQWYNIKTIYHDRKTLQLTSTRLSLFSDPGLTPLNLGRISVCIALTVLSLLTAGSFAIVGVTETSTQPVIVRNKLVAAHGKDHIDFRDHVFEAGQVSGTAALIRYTMCSTTKSNGTKYFASINNDLEDITSPNWDLSLQTFNSTCLMTPSLYKEEPMFEEMLGEPVQRHEDCRAALNFPPESSFPRNQISQAQMRNFTGQGECPFKVLNVWCSNYRVFSCHAALEFADGYGDAVLWYLRGEATDIFFRDERYETPAEDGVLRSMSFLRDVQAIVDPHIRSLVARQRIERNASVQKIIGTKDVTEIEVGLFCATLGTALLLTSLVAAAAIWGWITYILRPGRRQYNTFNTPIDALSCAAVETFQEGGCRFRIKDGVWVGCTGNRIGPIQLKD